MDSTCSSMCSCDVPIHQTNVLMWPCKHEELISKWASDISKLIDRRKEKEKFGKTVGATDSVALLFKDAACGRDQHHHQFLQISTNRESSADR